MSISKAKADFATGRLAVLKYFPSVAEVMARAQVSLMIQQMCREDSEAEWIVREMISQYNEWPGPKAMKDLHAAEFKKKEANVFQGWGEKPAILCGLCGDTGTVSAARGGFERCTCPGGFEVDQKYIDHLNGRTASAKAARGESTAFSRICKDEVQAIMKGRDQ